MAKWRTEYLIPGKGWVNTADMTGEDHLAVAELYARRARGEAVRPFVRDAQPDGHPSTEP